MRKREKRDKDFYESLINRLELFSEEITNLMTKTNKLLNNAREKLKSIINNSFSDISTNLKSTKNLIKDIKESTLINKISNVFILDAKDLIPI